MTEYNTRKRHLKSFTKSSIQSFQTSILCKSSSNCTTGSHLVTDRQVAVKINVIHSVYSSVIDSSRCHLMLKPAVHVKHLKVISMNRLHNKPNTGIGICMYTELNTRAFMSNDFPCTKFRIDLQNVEFTKQASIYRAYVSESLKVRFKINQAIHHPPDVAYCSSLLI